MTAEELKTKIDQYIKSNSNGEITGSVLNSVLNNILLYYNSVLTKQSFELTNLKTADTNIQTNINQQATAINDKISTLQKSVGNSLSIFKILPFDGIIENAVVQSASTIFTPSIYFVKSLGIFVGRANNAFYNNWNTPSTLPASEIYNTNGLANKFNLYIDSDGNIFVFFGSELTKIISGRKRHTTHAKVNRAIKELYIESSNPNIDVSGYHISQIVKGVTSTGTNRTSRIVISKGNTTKCIFNQITSGESLNLPPIVTFSSSDTDMVKGYAIVDWSEVEESTYWFDKNYEGEATLTNLSTSVAFSPSIFAYKVQNSL